MCKNNGFPKHTISFILILTIVCLFGSWGCVLGTVNQSSLPTDRDFIEFKTLIEKNNKLYAYAVKLFKLPIKQEGKIDKKNGSKYIKYVFSGKNEFSLESLPPESSIVRLIVPNGFSNESEAFTVLQQYVQRKGLKINWQKPTEKHNGNERTVRFEENENEDNAFPTMVYRNGKLVEIAFYMAL